MTQSNDTLPPPPPKTWHFREFDEDQAEALAKEFQLSPLTARLLATRDLPDAQAIQDFLTPRLASLHDPMLMLDMDRAVKRIESAIRGKEPIAIYGDYDVDGLTSTTLLVRFFKWIGIEVSTHIPHRINEGYGMNRAGIDRLAEAGARLIITVDNGISCLDEIAYAVSLGIDVVVTDHHRPGDKLPAQACAIVDPEREDCPYPFKHLSGCGVAFKLAHALARRLEIDPALAKPFLFSLLDLVALGTIADVMPLLGENRVLASFGLKELQNTASPGLRAMAQMLGLADKTFNAETVGFMFGPRLNAAGRTGNADDALELLLTESETRSWELAKYLDSLNQERRALESDLLEEAFDVIDDDPTLLDDPILVVAGEDWHQGVVGIVASRLLDRFGRPTIVLGIEDGLAKGSARSLEGFDIHLALSHCEDILGEYGGHKMAAGLRLPAGDIDLFRRVLNERVAKDLDPAAQAPKLEIHARAAPEELTFEMMEQLDRLRPFGQGNPSPTIALTGCRAATPPYMVAGKHLKIRLMRPASPPSSATLTAMWFNCPLPPESIAKLTKSPENIDVAGSPRVNVWNGEKSVEFTIRDIRPARS